MIDKLNSHFNKKLEKLIFNYEQNLSSKLNTKINLKVYDKIQEDVIEKIVRIQNFNLKNDFRMDFKSYYLNFFTNDPNLSIILVENKKPLGFIINSSQRLKDDYYTERIELLENYQKKAIGPKLLNISSAIAKGLKYKYHGLICSDYYKKMNLANFYQKNGFLNIDNKKLSNYMRRKVNKYSPI